MGVRQCITTGTKQKTASTKPITAAFQEMARFDWGFAICLDAQIVGFEERELWIGPIAAALFAVVTVERNEDALRIVSLRQASRLEKSEWRKEFHHG